MDKNGNFSALLIYFQNVSLKMYFICLLINFIFVSYLRHSLRHSLPFAIASL